MLILLSPSKSLNFENTTNEYPTKLPFFRSKSLELVKIMQSKSVKDLMEMMEISESIAVENVRRFKNYKARFPDNQSKAAIFAFDGDVYTGLDAYTLSEENVYYANDHVRILSGLYGVLKPLDKMQAYRLEMGRRLVTSLGSNLYHFWGDEIAKTIKKDLKNSGQEQFILNLASDEYFKAVNQKVLKADVLNINFKEERNGKLQFISYNAKKSRGQMARFVINHKIEKKEDLKSFDVDGYRFISEASTKNEWLFVK